VDGCDGTGDVPTQRAASRLGHGGGSLEPGVAHDMGHRFQQDLTLWTRHMEGNSPRGSSSSGGDLSRAHDGDRLAPSFRDVDDEVQRSAGNEIRLCGGDATHRRVMGHWLGTARSPTE
jgi:hypothetical protein